MYYHSYATTRYNPCLCTFALPDNNSMFNRSGGGTKSKPNDVQSPVAQALTEVLTASALTPRLPTGHAQGSCKMQPRKTVENRSSLYKQSSELQASKVPVF